jgi:antitoxin HicB
MLRYPALFELDGDAIAVSFRDIPEALAGGSSVEEAYELAADALRTAVEIYFEDGRPVPLPSVTSNGDVPIELPASVSVKVMLFNEMIRQDVTPAELAGRLNMLPKEVERIVDLGDATDIDGIADALIALGKRLEVVVS